MSKYLYSQEFELNVAPKKLFPYLNTASGLGEWFASKVDVNPRKIFHFVWDNESHDAKIVASRKDKYVKFEFLPENSQKSQDNSFLEFKIQRSELTNTTFLTVTDYSEMDDEEELYELWQSLILELRQVLGAK